MDYIQLMTRAARLRKNMGEDNNSPIDIFSLAHNIDDLTIVYYPFGDKVSGMCIKGQGVNKLIAINSAMTLGRQRFTLAHEFYHLFYDDSKVSVCSMNSDNGRTIEREADMFASYFLMPDVALYEMAERLASMNETKQLLVENTIKIEQFFGVSHQAAVFRLIHTPFLTEEAGELFLSTSVRSKAETLGYSPDLYLPAPESRQYMTYGHYIKQVEDAFEKNLISQGKYEELLIDAFRSDLVFGNEGEEGNVID